MTDPCHTCVGYYISNQFVSHQFKSMIVQTNDTFLDGLKKNEFSKHDNECEMFNAN